MLSESFYAKNSYFSYHNQKLHAWRRNNAKMKEFFEIVQTPYHSKEVEPISLYT